MSRLLDNVKSDYFKAINSLKPKKAVKTIMVYVENEDDIPFWRGVFDKYAPHLHFDIDFPSHCLVRGKEEVLKIQAGEYLLLCVDSDYDYLLQDTTEVSKRINHDPYIFQTYTYSIENYKCYAKSLRQVCVSSSLNDEEIFDLVRFIKLYSNIIYELFLYSYEFEKQGNNLFSRDNFSKVIKILEKVDINEQGKQAIDALINSVDYQLTLLKTNKDIHINSIAQELEVLGVNKDNTYLFVKGHVIYDNVILMFLKPLDKLLKNKKFQEFNTSIVDKSTRTEKIKQYKAQITDIEDALRMNTNYYPCFLMEKIKKDVKIYLASDEPDVEK
jgi:hypothetical protein